MPLTATIAPRAARAPRQRSASRGRRRPAPRRAAARAAGRARVRLAWKRRSAGSSYSRRHAGAHRERRHRRSRPVVRDPGTIVKRGPQFGAVDERIAVAAIGRDRELRAGSRRTSRGRRRRRRGRPPARSARCGSRARRAGRASTAVTALDARQRRRLVAHAATNRDRPARPRPRSHAAASLRTKPASPSCPRAGTRRAGTRRPARRPDPRPAPGVVAACTLSRGRRRNSERTKPYSRWSTASAPALDRARPFACWSPSRGASTSSKPAQTAARRPARPRRRRGAPGQHPEGAPPPAPYPQCASSIAARRRSRGTRAAADPRAAGDRLRRWLLDESEARRQRPHPGHRRARRSLPRSGRIRRRRSAAGPPPRLDRARAARGRRSPGPPGCAGCAPSG